MDTSNRCTTVAFGDARDLDAARAARHWIAGSFGELHFRNQADALAAVVRGRADHAFLNIETRLGGAASGALQLLADEPRASVIGEVETELSASLLALPGASLAGIRSVRGSADLLRHAARDLEQLGIPTYATRDVTTLAAELRERDNRSVALCAPTAVGERLGFEVLRGELGDPGHWMRHWVVGRAVEPRAGTRSAALVGPVFGARTLKTMRMELQSRGASRFRVADRRGGKGDEFLLEYDHAPGVGVELLDEAARFCRVRSLGSWTPVAA